MAKDTDVAWRRLGAESCPQDQSSFPGEVHAAARGRAGTNGCRPQGDRCKKNKWTVRTLSGWKGMGRERGWDKEEKGRRKEEEG